MIKWLFLSIPLLLLSWRAVDSDFDADLVPTHKVDLEKLELALFHEINLQRSRKGKLEKTSEMEALADYYRDLIGKKSYRSKASLRRKIERNQFKTLREKGSSYTFLRSSFSSVPTIDVKGEYYRDRNDGLYYFGKKPSKNPEASEKVHPLTYSQLARNMLKGMRFNDTSMGHEVFKKGATDIGISLSVKYPNGYSKIPEVRALVLVGAKLLNDLK